MKIKSLPFSATEIWRDVCYFAITRTHLSGTITGPNLHLLLPRESLSYRVNEDSSASLLCHFLAA